MAQQVKESMGNAAAAGDVGQGDGLDEEMAILKNPMDGGAWWATVREVAKSQTRLSD